MKLKEDCLGKVAPHVGNNMTKQEQALIVILAIALTYIACL